MSTAPTVAYRNYVLALLFLMMTVNYIDRSIVGILVQPIEKDLHLTDTQIGVITGFAFVALYMFMGIPVARLAERFNRVTIISVSLIAWSAMTALCGLTRNYTGLLLCRVGVGIGEAGSGPPSQALIADYFPAGKRATAFSIFSLGIPLGGIAGTVAGGLIGQAYGWRMAFFIVGIPGLVLAAIMQLTVRDLPRGHSDTELFAAKALDDVPSLVAAAKQLFGRTSFRHFVIGAAVATCAAQGIGIFSAAYFMRRFGISLAQAGTVVGFVGGAGGIIGTLLGGFVCDWAAKFDRRWYAWLPALGMLGVAPLYTMLFLQGSWRVAAPLLILPPILLLLPVAPILGLAQNLVEPRMRATAVALLTLINSCVGIGFGPLVVGALADYFKHHAAPRQDVAAASAMALQYALIATTGLFLWAAVHFAVAGRGIRNDLSDAEMGR